MKKGGPRKKPVIKVYNEESFDGTTRDFIPNQSDDPRMVDVKRMTMNKDLPPKELEPHEATEQGLTAPIDLTDVDLNKGLTKSNIKKVADFQFVRALRVDHRNEPYDPDKDPTVPDVTHLDTQIWGGADLENSHSEWETVPLRGNEGLDTTVVVQRRSQLNPVATTAISVAVIGAIPIFFTYAFKPTNKASVETTMSDEDIAAALGMGAAYDPSANTSVGRAMDSIELSHDLVAKEISEEMNGCQEIYNFNGPDNTGNLASYTVYSCHSEITAVDRSFESSFKEGEYCGVEEFSENVGGNTWHVGARTYRCEEKDEK